MPESLWYRNKAAECGRMAASAKDMAIRIRYRLLESALGHCSLWQVALGLICFGTNDAIPLLG